MKASTSDETEGEVHFLNVILDDVFGQALLPGARYFISKDNKIKTCPRCADRTLGVAITDSKIVVDPETRL